MDKMYKIMKEIIENYWKSASELAKDHRNCDPTTKEIFLSFDDKFEEIRLIEISENHLQSGDIVPFVWSCSPEFNYQISLILLASHEWEFLKAGKLKLPVDWDLSKIIAI
jgi:hypothetical protein